MKNIGYYAEKLKVVKFAFKLVSSDWSWNNNGNFSTKYFQSLKFKHKAFATLDFPYVAILSGYSKLALNSI